MKPVRKLSRTQSGAVAVELALMLPLFVLFILGTFDLGLMAREHQILQNAVREAARYSSLPKNWVDARNPGANFDRIRQVAVDYCADQNVVLNAADVVIDQDHRITVSGKSLDASRVAATKAYTVRTPVLSALVGATVQLTAEGVFRNFHNG